MGDRSGSVALVPAGSDVFGHAVPAGKSDPAAPRYPGSRIFLERQIGRPAIEMAQLLEHDGQSFSTPGEGIGNGGAYGAGAPAEAARLGCEEPSAEFARTGRAVFADSRPAPGHPSLWSTI